MINDIVLAVTKTVTSTEEVGVTLKKLTLEMAAKGTPGRITLDLAPLDENGAWIDSAVPVRVLKFDSPGSKNPAEKYAASAFHALILNAKINPEDPATAGFIAMLEAAGATVTGEETVRDFAKILIPVVIGAQAS